MKNISLLDLTKLLMAGVLIHGVAIALFVGASKSDFSDFGKPVAIGISLMAVLILLRSAANKEIQVLSIGASAATLALSYLIAYHSLGFLAFHGLVSESEISVDYIATNLKIWLLLFCLYCAVIYSIARLKTQITWQ